MLVRCTCFETAYSSKTAVRRAKRSKIWDSGLVVTCIWGTFDLLVFNTISHFGVIRFRENGWR